jgi:hypothetical protein
MTESVGEPTVRDIPAEKPGRDPRAESRYAGNLIDFILQWV